MWVSVAANNTTPRHAFSVRPQDFEPFLSHRFNGITRGKVTPMTIKKQFLPSVLESGSAGSADLKTKREIKKLDLRIL
jgi:hypothetical protein